MSPIDIFNQTVNELIINLQNKDKEVIRHVKKIFVYMNNLICESLSNPDYEIAHLLINEIDETCRIKHTDPNINIILQEMAITFGNCANSLKLKTKLEQTMKIQKLKQINSEGKDFFSLGHRVKMRLSHNEYVYLQ